MIVQRTPVRSAIRPIATPPKAEPSQASETASAGTERTSPNSAAIGFSATMVMTGAPNETERMPSAVTAISQERRVSIVGAAAGARPAADAIVIALRNQRVGRNRAATGCSIPSCVTGNAMIPPEPRFLSSCGRECHAATPVRQ